MSLSQSFVFNFNTSVVRRVIDRNIVYHQTVRISSVQLRESRVKSETKSIITQQYIAGLQCA